MRITPYDLPGELVEYLPDPVEPIDRWLQMPNASNIRTTAKIMNEFGMASVDAVVDPFAGGGSTAMAARLMGLPFRGIELDPVLVCACIAKSSVQPGHADFFRRTMDDLLDSESQIEENTLLPACLEILLRTWAQTTPQASSIEMAADASTAQPFSDSRVVWGNCTTADAWEKLGATGQNFAMYTSPPFGLNSPRLNITEDVRQKAAGVLRSAGLATPEVALGPFLDYTNLTVDMLRYASRYLRRLMFVIEHEPADDGSDCRPALVEALRNEFGSTLHDLRVLECPAFSWRGHLSLIVGELVAA